MAISEVSIKNEVLSLLNITKANIIDQDQAIDDLATGLASIIKNAIVSATVTVNPGIPVTTSAPATGATTAAGTGSLS